MLVMAEDHLVIIRCHILGISAAVLLQHGCNLVKLLNSFTTCKRFFDPLFVYVRL